MKSNNQQLKNQLPQYHQPLTLTLSQLRQQLPLPHRLYLTPHQWQLTQNLLPPPYLKSKTKRPSA